MVMIRADRHLNMPPPAYHILEQALDQMRTREFTVYVEHNPPQPNEVAVETVGPASKNKETNNELGTRGVGISEEDSEFLDDEYDMGIDSGEDDDDLFEKFVDEASAEMGIGEGSSSEYDSNDVVAKIKHIELREQLKKLEGSPEHQFTKLWDYAEEVRRTNPGSTVILGINDENGQNRFEKFYVCLNALKQGFLGGIPCKHACSAIFNQNLQPKEMVHPYYNVDTYKTVYEPGILPISGEMLWTETGFIPPLPPNFERGPGRPAGARNREPDELKDKASKKKLKKRFKLKRQHVKHHCKICGEEGHNAKGCALYKDMQEPGLDEIVMDRLFSDQTRKSKGGASSQSTTRKRKNCIYQDPMRVSDYACYRQWSNDQPPILPPIVEEHEPMQHDVTPHILTEPGPTPTPPCVQGPMMYDQLRMAHTNVSFQPQVILQPRINIRAPPPMTGTSFMPCFSSKPAVPRFKDSS
ncbi:UNVERIFIED_CONTAM: hypothetical protein Slati_1910800 [Sesamum latifolium]|uniref:CCHC-type domain-containing protein n=1 Tax=Sesamum latifolium TaxID=2727402 RepID=A0AAW2X0Y4_9LAMI